MMGSVRNQTHNDKDRAPQYHLFQMEGEVETVVLILLRHITVKGNASRTATSERYRPSQLLSIAQAFFALSVVCSSKGGVHAGSVPPAVCTERDLYYRNPTLFGHQRLAHASIERFCRWLDVARLCRTLKNCHITLDNSKLNHVFCKPQYVLVQLRRLLGTDDTDAHAMIQPPYTRESVGVTAAGKSTLAGALMMELSCPPEIIDLPSCGTTGVSLTYSLATRLTKCYRPLAPVSPPLAPPASALVLIEKESIYHSVLQCAAKNPQRWSRSFSFLCTKGYPCVAAREWLRRVHAAWPSLELHVLVDGDPHGLCITLTALGLLGKRARQVGSFPAAELLPFHFIGVRPSRVFNSGISQNNKLPDVAASRPALPTSAGISLTNDDRQVLHRVRATIQNALSEERTSAATYTSAEAALIRCTLEKMMQEVDWMERANIKCELQLACRAYESPLYFIESFISN